ncbi:hypothetical protein P0Y35_16460 [Kiritimatiellaeota bacterium B1221]|nr:hypothetical protein [Kiritimatiellaeota bacterium B1221]
MGSLLRAADPQPRRVAVLEVGEEPVPEALVALMEARILEQEDRVVLLERSSVDRLLQEQALGLRHDQEFGGRSAIQAGKIWGVDVFLLVEKVERNLRVRMVDAWYGLKILDVTLPVPRANEMEKAASRLAKHAGKQLSVLDRDPEGMRLVGVLDFRSVEASDRLDGLSASMQAVVEQQMMFQPGLIVVERRQLQALVEEHALLPELSEGLKASLLLLDGEFHLDEKDEDQLVLYVQARRNHQRLFRIELKGSKENLPELGARVAVTIREKLDESWSAKSMSREAEAEMLLQVAAASKDPEVALGAVAAARALMPESDVVLKAYLNEQFRWFRKRPLSLNQLRQHVLDTRRIMDAEYKRPDFLWTRDFREAAYPLSHAAEMWSKVDDAPLEVQAEISRELFEMFERNWEAGVGSGVLPDRTLQWHLKFNLKLFNRIGLTDADQISAFYAKISRYAEKDTMETMSNRLYWPKSFSTQQRFNKDKEFYTGLLEDENLFLRMCGMRGLARIYASAREEGKYELARKWYEKFEQEFLFEYLPTVGAEQEGNYEFTGWIRPFLKKKGFYGQGDVPCMYFADPEKSTQYRADHAMRVMRQIFADPNCPQRQDWLFSHALLDALNETGRIEEKVEALRLNSAYLQRGLESYKGRNSGHVIHTRDMLRMNESWLNQILEKYPEFRKPDRSPAVSEYAAERLVDSQHMSFDKLILEHGQAAILGRKGILFLDPDTLKPLRFEPAPENVTVYGRYAVDDAGIYTVSKKGILFFPREGAVQMTFKDHVDLSGKIFGIEVLNNRVYLLTGDHGKRRASNFLEFDLATETSSLLLTSKARVKEQVMEDLIGINFVMAEAKQNRLHLSLQRPNMRGSGVEPYIYDLETKAYTSSKELNVFPFVSGTPRRRGERFFATYIIQIGEVELKEGYPRLAAYTSREHHFDTYRAFARVGQGFVGILGGDLNYFPGQDEPVTNIEPMVFPDSDGRVIRMEDLATHERLGLLILRRDGLYVVPGLHHPREEEL